MASPGAMPAALEFVPNWWKETTDPAALDGLLVGWARSAGWRACGFVWPGDQAPPVVRTVEAGVLVDRPAPPETPDALRRLRAGEATALYSVPGSTGRVFAGFQPAGRCVGLLWAERPAGQPWDEVGRAYLVLTAKNLENSPAVSAVIGPSLDPDKLFQRLGDAAVIAGRMAHDFDNILTGIIGFSDLALPLLSPGSQAAKFVAEIGKVGHRGTVFTQQLHQLSRSGQVKPNPTSVAAALAKEELRVRNQIGSVRIEKELPGNLPAVAIESGPLQVVLGHLLENAAEACPPDGLVRVAAFPVELSESEARGYLGRATAGAHVLVTVTDTGSGIKPEVRRRLFVDPFLTTKVRHRGLGLAIAYRILFAHRGGIQIDSVPPPGCGTQVRLVLPLALSPARPSVAAANSPGRAVAAGASA
jgi:signal transduction histidine kinase